MRLNFSPYKRTNYQTYARSQQRNYTGQRHDKKPLNFNAIIKENACTAPLQCDRFKPNILPLTPIASLVPSVCIYQSVFKYIKRSTPVGCPESRVVLPHSLCSQSIPPEKLKSY